MAAPASLSSTRRRWTRSPSPAPTRSAASTLAAPPGPSTTGLSLPQPTLSTDARPAATIAQVEIFGPVLVSMPFRTPDEAVALANNTPYGLAASIWSESVNLALHVAGKLKAGTVWINSTNLFDAASGFGGYRESGFGREGGREGLYEYLRPAWESGVAHEPASVQHEHDGSADGSGKGKKPRAAERAAPAVAGNGHSAHGGPPA